MRYIISLVSATLLGVSTVGAEVPRVVTDMPPVHSLAALVMGDLGQPVLLLEKGASPHGFQLRPSQAAALGDAQLVIWTGPTLAPWLEHLIDSGAVTAPALSLLAVPGTQLQPYALDPDEVEPEESGHDHDEHDQDGATDPHAWLDPDNARLWLGTIAAELGRIDPDNAPAYAANAKQASAAIGTLDATLAATLAPLRDKPIVVFHDAYGYFAAHYGLTLAGSVSLGDAASPGAARLSQLRETVAAGTPLCIFPESQFDPALMTQIADGTDIRIGESLDPEGSTLEPGPALYATLMTTLAQTIAKCLSGD